MDPPFNFTSNFGVLDWAIVAVYLSGTVALGIFANRFIKDMADYMVAGRSLKSFISVATMLGSEIGLVTVMYTSQKGVVGGFAAFHMGLAAGLTCLLVGLTGFIVVPLRRTGVMTIPEFYEQRYGRGVRILGGAILSIAGILNMGVYLKAGGIFVTELTGMSDPVMVNWVMATLIGLVLTYTILGGMVSVVITDYIQFIVLSFGMLFVCLFAVAKLGWQPLVDTVKNVHGPAGFDPFDQGGFGVSYVIWMLFTFGIVSCAIWPTAVMRVLAAKDENVVRRLYQWSSIGFMTRFIIPQFLGICALTWLWQIGPETGYFVADGALTGDANETFKAMPRFLAWLLPTGLIGLIAAGMLAAFMSTHDSYLLCWATSIVEDVINPSMGGELSMKNRLLMSRILIFLIGVFLLVWSIWYPLKQDMLDYLAVSASIYFTGAFALLFLGLYWKGASRCGAYAALVTGLITILGLTPIREALGLSNEDLGVNVSEAHIGLSTIVLAVIVMVTVSILIPDRNTDDATGEA